MNSKMVKSEMGVLTRKEKADVDGCSLLLERWWARGREKANVAWAIVRYS
jgi:hypothetical protein